MADFNIAVQFVLRHEGGLSTNPNDPGDVTNFGISQRQFPQLDIRSITQDQAVGIYRAKYWPQVFDGFSDQVIANKVLDMSVNLGPSGAGKIIQAAVSYFVVGPVVIDGIIGSKTVEFANEVGSAKLLPELKARAAKAHADLAAQNPHLATFLLGWLRRDIDG